MSLKKVAHAPIRFRYNTSSYDLVSQVDPNAKIIWSRFYDLQSNQPFTVHTDLTNNSTSTFSGFFLAAIFDDNFDYVADIQVLEEENGLPSDFHYTNGLNFSTNGLELASKVSTKEPYYFGNVNASLKIAAFGYSILLDFALK